MASLKGINPLQPVRLRILSPRSRPPAVRRRAWYVDSIEVLARNALDGHHIWSRRVDGRWFRAVAVRDKVWKYWQGWDWKGPLPEGDVPPEIVEAAFLEWQRRQPVDAGPALDGKQADALGLQVVPLTAADRRRVAARKRAEKVDADLARWQRKLKLAQTKVKKLRAKQARYQRRGVT